MMASTILPARNCTTRLAGLGVPRAASPPHALNTRRRCCPTARCWWRGEGKLTAVFLGARNCTDRTGGVGGPPAAPRPRRLNKRRRCCPTARGWGQGGKLAGSLLEARKRPTPGGGGGG